MYTMITSDADEAVEGGQRYFCRVGKFPVYKVQRWQKRKYGKYQS